MTDKIMMKSQKYQENKCNFSEGVIVSPKLDGIPLKIMLVDGEVKAFTSGNNESMTVNKIKNELVPFFKRNPSVALFGEVYKHGVEFGTISGNVRRFVGVTGNECDEYSFNIFDYVDSTEPDMPYMEAQRKLYWKLHGIYNSEPKLLRLNKDVISIVTYYEVFTPRKLMKVFDVYISNGYEGAMVRSKKGTYRAGKRSGDCMKLKPTDRDTIDLKVVGFTEAKDKHGQLKDTLGSIQVKMNGEVNNIGCGSLTKVDRQTVWDNQGDYMGCIAEIRHMKDESYTKLRQPHFFRWRFDKTKGNDEDDIT